MPIEVSDIETSVDTTSNDGSGGGAPAPAETPAVGQSDGSEGTSIVGAMRRIAEGEARRIRTFDIGVVTSVFPHASAGDDENYYCSVRLRDSDSDELRNVPVLTSHIGFAHVPNIGDLVLVGYVGGSVNSPVIVGSLYNDGQRPPVNKAGEVVYESPDGADSSGDLRRIYLKFPSGMEITITDKAAKLAYRDTKVELTTDGDISLGTENKFAVRGEGASGSVTVESKSADVTVKSAGNLSIECTGQMKLKAASISVESDATTDIKAGATMNIRGSLVNIN